MDNEERKQASKMHMSFFDKSRLAIEEGYYLEAVMYEYAAIEGRLEVICGLLGCPCNKELDSSIRNIIGATRQLIQKSFKPLKLLTWSNITLMKY